MLLSSVPAVAGVAEYCEKGALIARTETHGGKVLPKGRNS